MTDSININIFPLVKQDFEFQIYKKICEDESVGRKIFDFSVKRLSLPEDTEKNRQKYYITLNQRNGFSKAAVSSLDNVCLTIWYLSDLLNTKLKENNINYKQGNKFLKLYDYVIKETELGNETICIMPTYQNKIFGFLLDYHFFKNKNVAFSSEVQKKSLSLDPTGKENKNYYFDKYKKIDAFIKANWVKIFSPLNAMPSIFVSDKMFFRE